MIGTNYVTVALRASAATSGAAEQDTAVTLPQWVREIYVRVEKTAEANIDNLLTVRIQGQVGSDWVDLPFDWVQTTGALTTAADTATNVTRAVNVYDGGSDVTFVILARYSSLPTNVIRVASVSSGTTVANTFEVDCAYRNQIG